MVGGYQDTEIGQIGRYCEPPLIFKECQRHAPPAAMMMAYMENAFICTWTCSIEAAAPLPACLPVQMRSILWQCTDIKRKSATRIAPAGCSSWEMHKIFSAQSPECGGGGGRNAATVGVESYPLSPPPYIP